jgi:AraC-like DNA-binding protein
MRKIEISSENNYKIDNDLILFKFSNIDQQTKSIFFETKTNFIQFHFCLKGECNFIYNNGSYCLPLKNEISILLYNPIDPLPVDVRIDPETRLISLLISIEKLHGLFSKDSETIPFLSENNINKKFYKDKPLSPSMLAILNQLLNEKIGSNVKSLYLKGKIFELLSVYFNASTNLDIDLCPFLSDDNNVKKIKKAKEIIIDRMADPPSLVNLSNEVEISVKNLKEGFKQVYGNTVYGYLIEHKMNVARQMLTSKNYNVNEVAIHLGYSTSSHFISSFKNKFGTTPKKFIASN